tara:strand:+ start:7508 stop:9595 length:2088 start_codon:yes stop_codon:yes gene_type:complete
MTIIPGIIASSLLSSGGGGDSLTDDYWANVVFLSAFEDVDTGTAYVDDSEEVRVITSVGNAQADTAQFKFGASSLLVDGTGDYVTVPDVVALSVLAADFTLEGWFRWNTDPAADQTLAGKWTASGNLKEMAIVRDQVAGTLSLYLSNAGTTTTATIAATWAPTLATWYHVAVDFDGTTYRLYVDGAVVGTSTTVTTPDDLTSAFSVGAQADGVDPFDGWCDDVRFTIGTARYKGAFTPRVSAFPRQPTPDANWANVVFLSDLEDVDTGTAYLDESDDVRTITSVGNAQADTAQFRFGASSLLLDGTGDLITIPDTTDLSVLGADFTIDGWFRWNTDPAADQFLIGKYQAASSLREYGIVYDGSANNLELWISNDGTAKAVAATGAWTPTLSTWYHVAADFDGVTYRVYIDGAVIGSGTTITTPDDLAIAFSVGAQPDAVAPFDGWVDDARMTIGTARYAGAFTAPTVPAPRENDTNWDNVVLLTKLDGADTATSSKDVSNSRHALVFEANAQLDTAQKQFGASSLLVDGTLDSVSITDSTDWDLGDGDFTVECWVRFNSIPTESAFVGQYDTAGNDRSWMLWRNNANGLIFNWSTNGTNFFASSAAWSPSTGVWYAVAADRSGGTLRVYVDGAVHSSTTSISTDVLNNSAVDLHIGDQANGGREMNGWIDEVRVTKGVARYAGAYTVRTKGFPDY